MEIEDAKLSCTFTQMDVLWYMRWIFASSVQYSPQPCVHLGLLDNWHSILHQNGRLLRKHVVMLSLGISAVRILTPLLEDYRSIWSIKRRDYRISAVRNLQTDSYSGAPCMKTIAPKLFKLAVLLSLLLPPPLNTFCNSCNSF